MLNLALIYNKNSSDWVSCNSILENIIKSYTLMQHRTFVFNANTDQIADQIIDSKITHMIYADHRLMPMAELNELVKKLNKESLPMLVIHVYGDFMLNLPKWKNLEIVLKNFKIKFICASTAQAGLLKTLLKQKECTFIAPFPVNSRFNFNILERNEFRQKHFVNQNEIVICYTGRISMQKNVLHLLKMFNSLYSLCTEIKLVIAGEFDDIGVPYLRLDRLPLTMEFEFYNMLETFPEKVKERILFLGNLNQEDLVKLYNGSDLYISLSTHNDEDFGMSPAEALCCGLPLVLTDWGGFKDFRNNLSERVTIIGTKLTSLGYKPNISRLSLNVFQLITKLKETERFNNSISAQKIYYPQEVNTLYHFFLDGPISYFKGFTSLFNITINKFYKRKYFINNKKVFDPIYDELYKEYI